MKLAIMQPYLFPYIGYYQAIHAADKYILYDNVKYVKQGYVNRNRILIANGKPSYFVVPIRNESSLSKISHIEIVDYNYWKIKFLNILYFNYKKCNYFEETFNLIESILVVDSAFLSSLNARSIIDICRHLDISTNIVTDMTAYADLEEKLDSTKIKIEKNFSNIKLINYEKKVVRIMEICQRENAKIYINAIGGKKLYDKTDFTKNNIELLFVKTDEIIYEQRSPLFYPNLSIVDVLMNCGKEKTKELLLRYDLV